MTSPVCGCDVDTAGDEEQQQPEKSVPKDLMFGIWANVAGSTMMHDKVKYPDNAQIEPIIKSGLP